MALCVAFVWHWVCLCLLGVYLVFVCLPVCLTYVWHGVCLFVRPNRLCVTRGLSVCPSVQVMFGMGFVCLSVCTSYVWHGVCPFVRLNKLCLAWGLSVCPSVQFMFGMGFVCSKHSSLIVFGIFGSPEKDCLLVLKKGWLLQQELYSAILPGHCYLIIEVVLLASLPGFLSGPPPAAPPINPQSPGTSSSSSSSPGC